MRIARILKTEEMADCLGYLFGTQPGIVVVSSWSAKALFRTERWIDEQLNSVEVRSGRRRILPTSVLRFFDNKYAYLRAEDQVSRKKNSGKVDRLIEMSERIDELKRRRSWNAS